MKGQGYFLNQPQEFNLASHGTAVKALAANLDDLGPISGTHMLGR